MSICEPLQDKLLEMQRKFQQLPTGLHSVYQIWLGRSRLLTLNFPSFFSVVIGIGLLISFPQLSWHRVKLCWARLVLGWVTLLVCQSLMIVFQTKALGASLEATVWIPLILQINFHFSLLDAIDLSYMGRVSDSVWLSVCLCFQWFLSDNRYPLLVDRWSSNFVER